MGEMLKRKGQVTIFVIVGVMIVVGVVIVFLLMRGGIEVSRPVDVSPRDMVRNCVEDVVGDSIDKMLRNGGEGTPGKAIAFNGEEWNYLCYQTDYYLGCYNIHPMLELEIEREIEEDSYVGVQTCFNDMKMTLEDAGIGVSMGEVNYSVDLLPGYVGVDLKRDVDVVDVSGSQTFEDFDLRVTSPVYDLVQVARDIVSSESQFCNFEYNGYMLIYPRYDIRVNTYQDSHLYRVIDRRTTKEFRFAVRSCAFPIGI